MLLRIICSIIEYRPIPTLSSLISRSNARTQQAEQQLQEQDERTQTANEALQRYNFIQHALGLDEPPDVINHNEMTASQGREASLRLQVQIWEDFMALDEGV